LPSTPILLPGAGQQSDGRCRPFDHDRQLAPTTTTSAPGLVHFRRDPEHGVRRLIARLESLGHNVTIAPAA
jgi:hypothetical protein